MDNRSMDVNDNGSSITVTPEELPRGVLFAYNAYLSCTIAFGVPGNLLVLLVYLKHGPARGTDSFIIFITFYDFITTFINVPVYLTFTTGTWKYYGNDIICKVHMFLSQTVVLSSAFIICGLAIERYHAVCKSKLAKLSKSRNTCLVISATAAVFSAPCFAFYENKEMHCKTVSQRLLLIMLVIYYTIVLLSFLIVIVTLTYTYFKITATINRSQQSMRKHLSANSDRQSQGRRHITFQRRVHYYHSLLCCNTNTIHPVPYNSKDESNIRECFGKSSNTYPGLGENKMRCNTKGENRDKGTVIQTLTVRAITDTNNDTVNEDKTTPFCALPGETCYGTNASTKNTSSSNESSSRFCSDMNRTQEKQRDLKGIGTDTTRTRFSTTSVQAGSNGSALAAIKRLNEHRRLRRCVMTTRIAFLICLIFVLSWLPPWISFISFVCVPPATKLTPLYQTIDLFCEKTYLINTFTNPILYTILNKTFRQKLRGFICLK